MPERYKILLLANDNTTKSIVFTNRTELRIGSGLQTDLRIQQASVRETHVQVFFDRMKVRVFGNNVFLNGEELTKDEVYPIKFGDVLNICGQKFGFALVEPSDYIDHTNVIIRHPSAEFKGITSENEEISPVKRLKVEDDKISNKLEESIVSAAVGEINNHGTTEHLSEEKIINNSEDIKKKLESKKDQLDEEIKESIDHPVKDTPLELNTEKKHLKDLGEAVIEKEIIDTAEKVVENKMKEEQILIGNCLDNLEQSVKDNIKEELKEDLKADFMEDVKSDIRNEVKDVLSEGVVKDAIIAEVITEIAAAKKSELDNKEVDSKTETVEDKASETVISEEKILKEEDNGKSVDAGKIAKEELVEEENNNVEESAEVDNNVEEPIEEEDNNVEKPVEEENNNVEESVEEENNNVEESVEEENNNVEESAEVDNNVEEPIEEENNNVEELVEEEDNNVEEPVGEYNSVDAEETTEEIPLEEEPAAEKVKEENTKRVKTTAKPKAPSKKKEIKKPAKKEEENIDVDKNSASTLKTRTLRRKAAETPVAEEDLSTRVKRKSSVKKDLMEEIEQPKKRKRRTKQEIAEEERKKQDEVREKEEPKKAVSSKKEAKSAKKENEAAEQIPKTRRRASSVNTSAETTRVKRNASVSTVKQTTSAPRTRRAATKK